MPFLRFSRDKRGYEHFYLVQPFLGRRGKLRARILYWFRTPPNVKVGRKPFAEHVQRALEAEYPDLKFDWNALVKTPIPAPDTDRRRERRRVGRSAKQVAEAEPAHRELEADASAEEPALITANSYQREEPAAREGGGESVAACAPEPFESTQGLQPPPDQLRRRRRRRRGRRNRPPGNEAPPPVSKPEGE